MPSGKGTYGSKMGRPAKKKKKKPSKKRQNEEILKCLVNIS